MTLQPGEDIGGGGARKVPTNATEIAHWVAHVSINAFVMGFHSRNAHSICIQGEIDIPLFKGWMDVRDCVAMNILSTTIGLLLCY